MQPLNSLGTVARASRPHAAAALVFLAGALVAMGPVLEAPDRLALGHPGNDVWNHVWGYWYVGAALFDGHLPLETDLLNWPGGGALWFIDALNAVLTLPIQALWGPTAAYNSAMGANLWLCGMGAYVLAFQVTRSWGGAIVAGVAYMSAPHFIGQAYNGISETLAAGWLPLALAAMRHAAKNPTWKTGAVAGLLLGLNTVANWYYGLFGLLCLTGLGARELWRLRARPDWREHGRRMLWATLPAAGVSLALAVPPFLLFSGSMGGEDAVVGRDPDFVWMTLVMHNMTDAIALVRPGDFQSPDLKALFDEDLKVVVYVGMALIGPAVGVLLSDRRRQAASWGLLALAFLVLTLGPYLYVAGEYVRFGDRFIPLPFLVLFEYTPVFSRISHAYRFVVGLTLALAVLAAFAVDRLAERGVPWWAAVLVLCGLRLTETAFLSPVTLPLPTVDTRAPDALAQLDGGAVLDLPISMPVLRRSEHFMGQLRHGQPVPYGLNDPTPVPLYLNRYSRYLIEIERTGANSLPPTPPALDLAVGQAALVEQGLRWIVVHQDMLPDDRRAVLEQFLDRTAVATYDGEGVRIYRLD